MLANGFYELGMKPGESVMAWTDNRSETLASFYACALTGLRLVTVDPSIKEADVLRFGLSCLLLMCSDIVKEAEPSALLFNPNSKKDCREHVLCQMIPELVSGFLPFLDLFTADKSMMVEPIKSREFRKLRTVATTAWDASNVPGVINFRTLLVDQVSPDLVSIVSHRLVNEPSTVLLRSYAYSLGNVLKVCYVYEGAS
jgi:acyl-CoA synthetase (AMP-forming)/AMP-acid ligase II